MIRLHIIAVLLYLVNVNHMISTLITIVIVLVVASLVLWLINTYLQPPLRMIVTVLVVIALILWLLKFAGIYA